MNGSMDDIILESVRNELSMIKRTLYDILDDCNDIEIAVNPLTFIIDICGEYAFEIDLKEELEKLKRDNLPDYNRAISEIENIISELKIENKPTITIPRDASDNLIIAILYSHNDVENEIFTKIINDLQSENGNLIDIISRHVNIEFSDEKNISE